MIEHKRHRQAVHEDSNVVFKDLLDNNQVIAKCVNCGLDLRVLYPRNWDKPTLITALRTRFRDCTEHPRGAFDDVYLESQRVSVIRARKRGKGRPVGVKNNE